MFVQNRYTPMGDVLDHDARITVKSSLCCRVYCTLRDCILCNHGRWWIVRLDYVPILNLIAALYVNAFRSVDGFAGIRQSIHFLINYQKQLLYFVRLCFV